MPGLMNNIGCQQARVGLGNVNELSARLPLRIGDKSYSRAKFI